MGGATRSRVRVGLWISLAVSCAAVPSGTLAAPVSSFCKGEAGTEFGTGGVDVIRGTPKRDVILGLGGSDHIVGLGGSDLICGGAGNDRLLGGPGSDELFGEEGGDRLDGGSSAAGDPDLLDGGSYGERNSVFFDSAKDGVEVSLGNRMRGGDAIGPGGIHQRLKHIDAVVGTPFADQIYGSKGDGELLFGGGGDDFIAGRGEGDVIKGEGGSDELFAFPGDRIIGGPSGGRGDTLLLHSRGFATPYPNGALADLGEGEFKAAGSTGTFVKRSRGTIASIENLGGSRDEDLLIGDQDDNILVGLTGDDKIFGHDGVDNLQGGGDDDDLYPGVGEDEVDGGDNNAVLSAVGNPSGGDTARFDDLDQPIFAYLHLGVAEYFPDGDFVNLPETDQLVGIENLTGTQRIPNEAGTGNELEGDAGPNVLTDRSNTPFSILIGHGGNDYLLGTGDCVAGDGGLNSGCATNPLVGIEGNDRLVEGGHPHDGGQLEGDGGDDALTGGPEDDYLDGGTGSDALDGKGGFDQCLGWEGVTQNCEELG